MRIAIARSLLLAALASGTVDASSSYTLTPLKQTLPGFHAPNYRAMSSNGRLLGSTTHDNGQYSIAVQWVEGQLIHVGLIGGYAYVSEVGINSQGAAVGLCHSAADSQETSFHYVGGVLFDTEDYLPDGVRVMAVGDDGLVAAEVDVAGSPEVVLFPHPAVPPMVILQGTNAEVNAMSGDGRVVGIRSGFFGGSYEYRGFVWKGGQVLFDVPPLAGVKPFHSQRSEVLDVNDVAQAVGWVQVSGTNAYDFVMHAFLTTGTQMQVLGVPAPEYWRTEGFAINNAGAVLVKAYGGVYPQTYVDYFLWDAGVFTEVAELSPDPAVTVHSAVGIDDAGRILVTAAGHGFSGSWLLGPCDGGVEVYGDGCPGAGALTPTLGVTGCPAPGAPIGVSLGGAAGGASAFLVIGQGQAQVPIGAGCSLLAAPVLNVLGPLPLSGASAGDGALELAADLPSLSGPISLAVQAFVIDAAAGPHGFAASNGVDVCIP